MSAIEKINDVFSLKRFVPLNEFDHDKLKELMESSSVLQFKKGQPLVSGIEKNHNVYLLSGNVVRSPNSERALLIKAGDSHACQAIISPNNRPRIVAANSVSVLCVDAELLDLLLNWGADDGVLVDEINADEANEWVDGFLQNDAILNLSSQSIQILMSVVEPVEVNANEVVFKQGDKPDYYYIVSQGTCVITRRVDESEKLIELARLGPGDAFGEEALIANAFRGATVSMSEDGLLLRLDQRNFKELLEKSLVNNITDERADRLKGSGAVVLDLRSASSFAKNKNAINIPYSELRGRIDGLDKNKKYIVVSDDNDLSAVGAFLLSKKGFKVYSLETKNKENSVSDSAESATKIKKLESSIIKLQKQLQEMSEKLMMEEKLHAASKAQVLSLESSLKETENGAKKAIIEASALKSKSESSLRNRIDFLTIELKKEQQNNHQLNVEGNKLKNELRSLSGDLDRMRRQAEESRLVASQAQNKGVGAEKKLSDLQQAHDLMLNEKIQLSQKVSQLNKILESQSIELNSTQERFEMVSTTMENLEEDVRVLQLKNIELGECLDKNEEEKQALTARLIEKDEFAGQQAAEINEIQVHQNKLVQQIEKAGQDNTALQEQRLEFEAELAQEKEERLVLLKQCEDACQKIEQQAVELKGLQEELYSASAQAGQNYVALQQQLEAERETLVETKLQFKQTESGYQQQIEELNDAMSRLTAESKQLSEEASRQKLRNNVIIEEMSKLQGEKTHGSIMIKSMLFVFLLLVAVAGGAGLAGIDVYAEANVLMENLISKFEWLVGPVS